MWRKLNIKMSSKKSGNFYSNSIYLNFSTHHVVDVFVYLFILSLLLMFNFFRELPTQVSLLVIDKKTNSKRKKKFIKISSSDPNVVLIYSEKISPINEEKILEAKNNLKNVSENINLDEKVEGNEGEVEGEVEDDSANQVDGNANENDIEDQDDYFSDNNSEINETAEMALMKIVLDVKKEDGEKQGVDEVDSNEVMADEAEEEILDDELFESPEMSYKTASSTASISSNEKVHRYRFMVTKRISFKCS